MARIISASETRQTSAARGRGLFQVLLDAATMWRHRRELSDLPPDRLRDLGLSKEDVRAEVQKPIWNAPDNWLR